jgi:hypothetical protein
MSDQQSKPKNYWLRWVGVLPGALLAGLLATFPLHWTLYFTLAHGETISGVNITPIERAMYPFVIALCYIVAGFKIAPKHKFKTSVILAVLYALFFIGLIVWAQLSGMERYDRKLWVGNLK